MRGRRVRYFLPLLFLLVGPLLAQSPPENSVQCVQDSPTALAYGDHTSGCQIDLDIDLDIFTFEGAAGDQIRVILRAEDFDPDLEFRDPSNNPLPGGSCSGAPTCRILLDEVLAETGTYQLRVSDSGFDDLGTYSIQLERTFPVPWATSLSYGVSRTEAITPRTDVDMLSFKGRAGSEVRIIVFSRSPTPFWPQLVSMHSPSGIPLSSSAWDCTGADCFFIVDEVLFETGNYSLVLADMNSDSEGLYQISVQCLFGDCPVGYVISDLNFEGPDELRWSQASDPSATYDVVRGDLLTVLAQSGDYASSVIECLSTGSALPVADALDDPDADQGFFYVARANDTEVGRGTYDSASSSQLSRYGGRDVGPQGIDASELACNGVSANFIADDPDPDPLTISMAPGGSSETEFDVQILATEIDDLFGAAFHIEFDPSVADFTGWTNTGSLLLGQGTSTFFQATLVAPGEVAVIATLLGTGTGVSNANGILVTLQFDATSDSPGAPFTFTPIVSRSVTVCPVAGQPCSEIAPEVTWSGGTLVVE